MKKENFLIIGKIKSSYGIYGWNKISSFTEKTINIFQYQPWFIKYKKSFQEIEVEKWKINCKNLICKIKNINNRNQSELIIKNNIFILKSQLPKLNFQDFYWRDIIGCNVFNTYGIFLGKVLSIIETGANDVLFLHRNNKIIQKNVLVPFIFNKIIKKVDIHKKEIIAKWDLYTH